MLSTSSQILDTSSETYTPDKLKTRLDKPIHYIQPVNSFDYYMKKYNKPQPYGQVVHYRDEIKINGEMA